MDVLHSEIVMMKETDYVHALLNCCLKTHNELILADEELMRKVK